MADADPHSLLLAETVARHFPDAKLDGVDIDLGFAGLRAHCEVNSVRELGEQLSASLFVWFHGGLFREGPIFASASGYGSSAEDAIVTGGCQWTCTFGPVLRSALAGEPPSESMETRDVTVHGRRMRLFIDGLDRAMLSGPSETPIAELMRASRRRLAGDRWMAERIIDAGLLPLLAAGRPTVLSVFCSDHAREPLARTLAGLSMGSADHARRSSSWRGWAAHGGRLDEPLGADALARLATDRGPLPDDYHAFLRDVAAGGAGPGYGLLRPDHPDQQRLAAGIFPYREDTEDAKEPPRGVLALAHAGCGVVWLLVLRGPRRGEVWVDAGGSDRGMRRVAASPPRLRTGIVTGSRPASWMRSRGCNGTAARARTHRC